MDVGGHVARGGDEPRRVLERVLVPPIGTVLDGQPLVEVGHIIQALLGRLLPLIDAEGAVNDVSVGLLDLETTIGGAADQELRDVGSDQIARRDPAEEGGGCHSTPDLGSPEVRELVRERIGRLLGQGVALKGVELGVAQQGHPVEFTHLGRVLRAVDSGCRRHRECLHIGALEVEGQPRLGIRQAAPRFAGVVAACECRKNQP